MSLLLLLVCHPMLTEFNARSVHQGDVALEMHMQMKALQMCCTEKFRAWSTQQLLFLPLESV